VDDFYKTVAYAYQYKVLERTDIRDMTVTLAAMSRPAKLIRHLETVRGCKVEERSPGIHAVTGDVLPVQIIETKMLPEKENLWLRNLRDDLDAGTLERLEEARRGKGDRVNAFMEAVVQANQAAFKEMIKMGKLTLMELYVETGIADMLRTEGAAKGKTETAVNMIRDGVPYETVARYTGFAPEKIAGLAKQAGQ
jgi:hypothetical protein